MAFDTTFVLHARLEKPLLFYAGICIQPLPILSVKLYFDKKTTKNNHHSKSVLLNTFCFPWTETYSALPLIFTIFLFCCQESLLKAMEQLMRKCYAWEISPILIGKQTVQRTTMVATIFTTRFSFWVWLLEAWASLHCTHLEFLIWIKTSRLRCHQCT